MKKTILAFVLFYSLSASAQWSELGGTNSLSTFLSATNSICTALYPDNKGNIYATVNFYVYGDPNSTGFYYYHDTAGCVVKWNGSIWQKITNASAPIIATYSTNYVYGAGGFFNASGMGYVAQWNGSDWIELGGQNALAANADINTLCIDSTGNLYAGGYFHNSSGEPYVAKWNGSQWTQLNGNFPGSLQNNANHSIVSMCSDGNGNIYAVTFYTNSAGNRYVAKWDGNSWSELGSLNVPLFQQDILCVTADNKGNIYAGGSLRNAQNKHYVAKWNGTAWLELAGSGIKRSYVSAISIDKYGGVYVLNSDDGSVGYISKWNGSDWIDFPADNYFDPNIRRFPSMCIDTLGNLYATVNRFDFANHSYANGYVEKYTNTYTVAVKELEINNDELRVYPNPAKESVSVELNNVNKTLDLKLIDISGRLIKQIPLSESTKVDVSDLSNGIYFFGIYSNGQHIKTAKIIKE